MNSRIRQTGIVTDALLRAAASNTPLNRTEAPEAWDQRAIAVHAFIRRLMDHFGSASIDDIRSILDLSGEAPGVELGVKTHLGGVPAMRFDVAGDQDGALLYFHGGGYIIGSSTSHADYVGRLAHRSGVQAFSVDYRLAPEDPYPAAVHDAIDAYIALTDKVEPRKVVVAGDSAGGGLTAALIQQLLADGLPPPGGAILICPWMDMTIRSVSHTENAETDVLTRSFLDRSAAAYLGKHAADDPGPSPLFGSFEGFPPTSIFVGEREILLDDAVATHAAMSDAGADVTLHRAPDIFHDWMIFLSSTGSRGPELSMMAEFVTQTISEI